MPTVGVLSQVQWGETAYASISISAYVSAHNHTVLQQMLQQAVTNTAVVLNFHVEEYDQVARAYYVAFAPTKPPLNALIGKAGRTPELQLASSTDNITQLYQVNFTVVPVPQVQPLTVATSTSKDMIMQWGGTTSQMV